MGKEVRGRGENEEVRTVAAEGEMSNEKGERLRLRGWREKEKCQMPNNSLRTRKTDTDTKL